MEMGVVLYLTDQAYLRGTDVTSGLVPFDMLFPGLQSKAIRYRSIAITTKQHLGVLYPPHITLL